MDDFAGLTTMLVMEQVRQMEACIEAVMKETGCPKSEVKLQWLGPGKGYKAWRDAPPQTEERK